MAQPGGQFPDDPGRDWRGPVTTILPKPTGRYLVMVVLALLVVGAAWGIFQNPDEMITIAGWVGAVVLVCWVVLVRPRITARRNGLQLTNMVRDVFIPWERIDRVRAVSVFQVVTDEGTYSCVGVGRSVRAQIKADDRYANRPTMSGLMLGSSLSRAVGLGSRGDKGPGLPEYVEQLVTRESDQFTRAREERGEAPRPIRRTWAVDGIGALGLATILLLAALIS
jgi:Bacterial PH domain